MFMHMLVVALLAQNQSVRIRPSLGALPSGPAAMAPGLAETTDGLLLTWVEPRRRTGGGAPPSASPVLPTPPGWKPG